MGAGYDVMGAGRARTRRGLYALNPQRTPVILTTYPRHSRPLLRHSRVGGNLAVCVWWSH